MMALGDLLENPFPSLTRVVAKLPLKQLKRELSRLNVPISATEYPLSLLESYLRDLFVEWRINSLERNRLLRALAR